MECFSFVLLLCLQENNFLWYIWLYPAATLVLKAIVVCAIIQFLIAYSKDSWKSELESYDDVCYHGYSIQSNEHNDWTRCTMVGIHKLYMHCSTQQEWAVPTKVTIPENESFNTQNSKYWYHARSAILSTNFDTRVSIPKFGFLSNDTRLAICSLFISVHSHLGMLPLYSDGTTTLYSSPRLMLR